MPRQVDPGSRSALEDRALFGVPVEDRVHGVVDRQDEAGAGLLRNAGDADVEPHRRVEGGLLGDHQVLELGAEGLGLVLVDEVPAADAPFGDGVAHAVDDLLERLLALLGAGGAAEVLLGHDVGGVERPRGRELDPELLERDRSVAVVRDPSIAAFPLEFVVGVDALGREVAADADAGLGGCDGHWVASVRVVGAVGRGSGPDCIHKVLWFPTSASVPHHKMWGALQH